ncbi:hypothetical protein ACFL1Z_04525 [Thermodesulfobacteriota bacterium]
MVYSNGSSSIFHIEHNIEGKLIDKIQLKNGLTLEMIDRSRHVAGDRWLVSFQSKIEVEIRSEYFEDQQEGDISFEAAQSTLGEKVTYRYEKIRNFIGEREVKEILDGMKERFLATSLAYLSKQEFPQKLILRKYKDAVSPAHAWKK